MIPDPYIRLAQHLHSLTMSYLFKDDLVQILADAIERAGTLDRAAIRDAMADTYMMTVVGPISFREDGTAVMLNALVQWQNGQQELVWPSEHATADFAYPALPFDER